MKLGLQEIKLLFLNIQKNNMSDINVISLPVPKLEHILSSEKKSEEYPDVKYYWEFIEDYEFSFYLNNHLYNYTIQAGFVSDSGTIPRIAWYFDNLAFRSYIVHDFFYKNKTFSRKEADLILKECLKFESVSLFDSTVIYCAVRLFGRNYYG